MRGRRAVVTVHRRLAYVLLAWVVVIGVTGAWIAVRHSTDAWLHAERYRTSAGDVGIDEASRALPPEGKLVFVVLPTDGRGVYQLAAEVPKAATGHAGTGQEGTPKADSPEALEERFFYVDPGTGKLNGSSNPQEGFGWWMYRGHMHLWQDNGVFGVFHPTSGWCRLDANKHEPGGIKGVACDVIPNGDDLVAWFAIAWMFVLFSGFYLWYWPGVKRWATALRVRRNKGRFAFNISLHKSVGLLVWLPLSVVAFTGAAFAFPNLTRWYENVTPAARGVEIWDAKPFVASPANKRPVLPLSSIESSVHQKFPQRTVRSIALPANPQAPYTVWLSKGIDPFTRESGGGNTSVLLDPYSGKVLADLRPDRHNVFAQAWQGWSFPVHSGDFGGTTTRVLWVALGISPIALGVTGLTMTLIRRRKRSMRPSSLPS